MSNHVIVRAKENSVSAEPFQGADGGTLNPGDILEITCSPTDEWELYEGGEALEVNANGAAGNTWSKGDQAFQTGALVGSLDGGKTFFSVGTYLKMTVLAVGSNAVDANLTLYCWDSDYANNGGTIRANITVTRPA